MLRPNVRKQSEGIPSPEVPEHFIVFPEARKPVQNILELGGLQATWVKTYLETTPVSATVLRWLESKFQQYPGSSLSIFGHLITMRDERLAETAEGSDSRGSNPNFALRAITSADLKQFDATSKRFVSYEIDVSSSADTGSEYCSSDLTSAGESDEHEEEYLDVGDDGPSKSRRSLCSDKDSSTPHRSDRLKTLSSSVRTTSSDEKIPTSRRSRTQKILSSPDPTTSSDEGVSRPTLHRRQEIHSDPSQTTSSEEDAPRIPPSRRRRVLSSSTEETEECGITEASGPGLIQRQEVVANTQGLQQIIESTPSWPTSPPECIVRLLNLKREIVRLAHLQNPELSDAAAWKTFETDLILALHRLIVAGQNAKDPSPQSPVSLDNSTTNDEPMPDADSIVEMPAAVLHRSRPPTRTSLASRRAT